MLLFLEKVVLDPKGESIESHRYDHDDYQQLQDWISFYPSHREEGEFLKRICKSDFESEQDRFAKNYDGNPNK